MQRFALLALLLLVDASAFAKSLLPTAEGTTWQYRSVEEAETPDGSTAKLPITCRLSGTERFAGRNLLKLETFYGGTLSKAELITVDRNGVRCFARTGKNGRMVALALPQTLVPARLKFGATWRADNELADVAVHEQCTVAAAEDISVAAGTFHAFRFRCEHSSPTAIATDRWFVPGTGFVKEVTTMRSPAGDLLGQRTLELIALPRVVSFSEADKIGTTKKVVVTVSSQPSGESQTEFSSSVQNIYARWKGDGLRSRARVRAVWIAEDVGDIAPRNYKIDDAVATAAAPDAHGMFTLSRPENGWAEGAYRVEFYLDETLVETVKLKIK